MISKKNIIFILISLSILRVFLMPFVGKTYTSLFAGALTVLIAGIFYFYIKDNSQLFFLKVYSIIMLIPILFFERSGLINSVIGYLETMTPILIFSGFSSTRVIKKFNFDIIIFYLFTLPTHYFTIPIVSGPPKSR